VELEKFCECVAEDKDERAAEAVQLSWSVMEISNALIDLDVFPVWDIHAQPRLA
jgi:hypothetical protein